MSDYTSNPSRPGSPVGSLRDVPTTRQAYRFNWDSSTRRPGPRSVSETTEGRGDYFSTTPKVEIYGAAGSASSTHLALNTVPAEWSSAKHGFHAISTVVNNPHKKSAPPKAHAAVPSVPLADLPRVRRKDFDAYLRAVGPEWERFQRSVELGRSGSARIGESSTSPAPYLEGDLDLQPSTPRTPRPTRVLPPLSSVPDIFFDPNFNLGDPRTFNAVAEVSPPASSSRASMSSTTPMPLPPLDPSALAHSLPLLEKLSHHADTLEQHLVDEIARRATSFFAALTNLQDLQAESSRCLSQIQSLRSQLQDVDKQGALRGLHAVHREARLEHLSHVREGVRMVGGVLDMVELVKSLVRAGQWGEALNVVDGLRQMWEGPSAAPPPPAFDQTNHPPRTPLASLAEEPPESANAMPTPTPYNAQFQLGTSTVALSSLKAFSALPSQLQTLTLEIAASLTTDAVAVLKVDLVERIYSEDSGSREEGDVALRDRLRPLVHGLVRTATVRDTLKEWREVVLGEVKGVVKRHISSFELDGDDPKAQRDAPWMTDLRAMSQPNFVTLLRTMYKNYLHCIEGLQLLNGILVETIDGAQTSQTSVDLASINDTLYDVLSSAAELANILASKVLSTRTEQHSKLELWEFVNLFKESWNFVVRCEVICRRMIVGLRGVVVSQAKSFLQSFHQTRISQSAKLVEDEQWSQAEIPSSLQHITNLIVAAAVRDPQEFMLELSPTVAPPSSPRPSPATLKPPPSPVPVPGSPTAPSSPRPHKNGTSPAKHLRIEERSYFAVSATQEVLIALTDYLKVIINLSLLTTDTMSRAIEFLKAFNSRTCQVVLGAGAMRSAGLKNITAKHLALASQSLSIMIALIPYVRETFRRHLNSKQAVMLVEFDKLKRDYQEHQNEIHAKLVAIMGDRLAAHIKSLQAIRWEVPPLKPGVNDYMELLVKETVTLHKVLSRYLSSTVVEYVMSQVFAAINHRLSEEYTKIDLPSLEAKERMMADAHHLKSKFSGLKSVGGVPVGMLETVVSEKRLPGQATPHSPLPLPSGTIPLASPKPTPTKRTSLFGNERLKGMLSRTPTLPAPAPVDKTPPPPSPASSFVEKQPSSSSRPSSPLPPLPTQNGSAHAQEQEQEQNGYAAAVGPPAAPALQAPPVEKKVGFRQVPVFDAEEGADEVRVASPVEMQREEGASPSPLPPPTPPKDGVQVEAGE
ncbi:Vps54-like protein-domain-containing protein [Amylostereum chailletii]|nr:Vps54-like protein-domain-containing protein [Amylostereum chailletii]